MDAARLFAALGWVAALTIPAAAQDRPDGPFPWQMDLQTPATLVMDYIHWFSWYTLVIVTVIVLFVIGLLAWAIWKFNERSNPVPSRVTHNTLIEVLWTVIPVAILVAIAIPSFKLLYGQYDPAKLYPDFDPETAQFLTLKVSGVQWAWDVSYANDEQSAALGVAEPISLYLLPIADDQLAEGQVRSLSVDNPIVVPVDTFVRLQVTAEGDAIHAVALPAFGIKEDAVPGRLNETYFKAEREGVFYGQCSELCGKDHAFMPLEVHVVAQDQFRTWAAAAATDPAAAYQQLAEAREAAKQEEKLAAR
jgi:cytochrome c oxidase subunit 2